MMVIKKKIRTLPSWFRLYELLANLCLEEKSLPTTEVCEKSSFYRIF